MIQLLKKLGIDLQYVENNYDLSIPEKVLLDVEYMHKKSFWFDLKILWMTFLKVKNSQDISH